MGLCTGQTAQVSLIAPHFVFRERVSVNPELIERISKVWTEGRCFMKLLFLNQGNPTLLF